MSKLHFTSTENHAKRVSQIIGSTEYVYNVGAPALDNLNDIEFLSKEDFLAKWDVDLHLPTVLVTYHPETVALAKNVESVRELCCAMDYLDMQFVITMPNNDTMGTKIRSEIVSFANKDPDKYKLVEVLGVKGYYSCMHHCSFLLGNTSSGIIEAASFGKYAINVGDRQKGREAGPNVINVPAKAEKIIEQVNKVKFKDFEGENIYGNGTATARIVKILKEYHNKKYVEGY